MNVSRLLTIVCALVIGACASKEKRQVLEYGNKEGQPDWVSSTKMTWNEGDQVLVRAQFTIRGDERVNGCYQLAKLDTKETLLREIAENIRGQIDNAQQSISESAEVILNQSRTSEFSGRVTGLRFLEQYHERYKIDGNERIDCYILGGIKKTDYDSVLKSVVYKMTEVDPGLKRAMNQKQIEFFDKGEKREISSEVQTESAQ